jgi:manganese efflux pump family protein
MLTSLLIALGLAMDAFAVSISSGVCIADVKVRHCLRMGAFFGVFQMVMPVIGWLAGLWLRRWAEPVDHWVAFALLGYIGLKMIREARQPEACRPERDPLRLPQLLMLSVATSIDALAVGVSFSMLKMAIITPILVIGAVTFSLSFAGVFIGNRIGALFGRKMETLGGLILIGMAIKILGDHILWH